MTAKSDDNLIYASSFENNLIWRKVHKAYLTVYVNEKQDTTAFLQKNINYEPLGDLCHASQQK